MHSSSEISLPSVHAALPIAFENLRERLQLVPPARIIAAIEDSGSILTLGDLKQFAKFLADECQFSSARAAAQPASWYEAMIEHCTVEQSFIVRTMTIEICEERALLVGYQNSLEVAKQATSGKDAALMILLGFVLAIGFGLLVTSDQDGPNDGMDAPLQVAHQHHAADRIAPPAFLQVPR